MNRGVEIAADVADLPNAGSSTRFGYGVAVRTAVLFLLLGSGMGLAARPAVARRRGDRRAGPA